MPTTIAPHAVATGDHVVQLYERDSQLIDGVSAYLSEGLRSGATGIVIATEAHRAALESDLRDAGVDATAAVEDGTLLWLDAAATLKRITTDDGVDPDAFFAHIGGLVEAAGAHGQPVRLFGEMVALLWEAGSVVAAVDLETLWNQLGERMPFSLYCAYHSDCVAADEVERVCHLHSAVVAHTDPTDRWPLASDHAAAREARGLVVDALHRLGHQGETLANARLVVTELVANAVIHGHPQVTVSLRSHGTTVRLLVADGSPTMPVIREATSTSTSGRGLQLVDALATRWGAHRTPAGKVIWAELSG
ncbi:MEDS domain-containing protein [Solirubrobacter deserti]|uniref:MEDS domain-containing protein n=1 Tax=Solirubrobacter deserti TaxID=2282478 RepID=A0ABT4RJH5_9ACTN|nr:MEDS domain-containing protein [Solirubrobacter deserti]MDA0138712.1 MEDS domain-containing protein [Solirubrobacter deserti]